jgi:hypothetical protein
MANYIEFELSGEEGATILVEVEAEDVEPVRGGSVKAGLRGNIADGVKSAVSVAVKPFESAMSAAISHNVKGLLQAVRSLPDAPSEVEITFGLKATGEASNLAVGKIGSEVNYNVKLVWKKVNGQP